MFAQQYRGGVLIAERGASMGQAASTGDGKWAVAIIGGGPSGATAALYAARAGWSTVVIDKAIRAGALGMSSKIANYPGVADAVTGAELVERIRGQAASFGASFVVGKIVAANLSADEKVLRSGEGAFRARVVIVATGSMGRGPSIPGEERLIGRGVSYCATCDGFFFADKDVAVVGNSDEALDEALFVARFARRVVIVCPTSQLRAADSLVQQATEHEKIEIRLSSRVQEVVGASSVEGVVVDSSGARETVPVAGAFVYLQGGQPIVDFAGGQLATTADGCLTVNDVFETSVPGVFAAGDVLCKYVKQAVIAAAEGAQAAIAADRYLSGHATLKPDWA
jgi:thioredoxin reductase (NADPH)